MVTNHPILFIDDLLKLGIGDEGRLFYIRKALSNGKTIYDSDKRYLEKLQIELNNFQSSIISTDSRFTLSTFKQNLRKSKKYSPYLADIHSSANKKKSFESYISSNQNLIEDLRRKDSKITDNLELLLINREISKQNTETQSCSSGLFFLKNISFKFFKNKRQPPLKKKIF